MKISLVPAFQDNYLFVLEDENEVAVVDPGDAGPILSYLKQHNLQLEHILITHHHADHIGGVKALQLKFPNIKIWGYKNETQVPFLTHKLADGATFEVCGRKGTLYATPGHTAGHCVYVFEPTQTAPTDIFCGDMLFGAGCGGLMGGTLEQMFHSLQKLRSFPDDTRFWCAHEYTEKNLWVALQVEPLNSIVEAHYKKIQELRKNNISTVPLSMTTEKETNPFFRFDDSQLKQATQTQTDFETFVAVRKFRDQF